MFHVVNNAYGLQCSKVTQELVDANNKGTIDILISSTDKNFMVPVGGSIIYGPKKKSLVEQINKFYPGRANGGPIQDLFITFLSMGETQLKSLLKARKTNFTYLKEGLTKIATKHGERVLQVPDNKISMACTLKALDD